jgi:hypothetical protein
MGWTIPNPCSKRFADMAGDERRRYCGDCGKFVHALELYSEAELAAMGPICGYIGGTTEGPRQGRRALLAGALLTTIAPLLAQEGQFVIAVKDAAGGVVADSLVTVGERKAKTDKAGIASFIGLPVGRQEVRVEMAGFRIWRGTYTITNGAPARVEAVLLVGTVGIYVEVDPKPVEINPNPAAVGTQLPGRVNLVVWDASGRVVAGADVLVEGERGQSLHGRTDWAGNAMFSDVNAGEFKVTVEREGFSIWRAKRVLSGGGEVKLEAKLMLRGQDVKVEVKESAGRRFWNWLSSCTRK